MVSQRAFVVVAENASAVPRFYRLTIEDQPAGGQASFLQFGAPLTTLDVVTPAYSSVARTVFVTAPQDSTARVRVSVVQVTGVGGQVVPDGLTGEVVLNPDPQNPVLQNPVLQNPVLQNPVLQNIAQGETYNPAISVALVGTPNLQNPVLQNPNLQNPNLQNPTIQNPYLQNPNLQNPVLQNPVLQNDLVANPTIVNPNLQNPVLQNPVLQNPVLQNPESAESESAERGDQRHQLGGDQRGEYHRLVHDQPGLEYRGAERLHDAAADSQDDAHTGGGRVRPQGTEAHCPDREHSRPGLRDDHRSKLAEPESSEPGPAESESSEPDDGPGAGRFGDGHAAHHRPEHLRRRYLRCVSGGHAGRRRAVRQHR